MQQDKNTYGHQLSPEFLAKYEVTGVLGEGGMGQVLRGRQKGLGREVAIKLLTLRSYATPERRERFKHEAQRCANMNHPNLVGVYDYGEDGERPYMVMELVDGESIADRIKRDGKFPIRETLEIGIKICEGLQYAHEQGLVHRDIKSDNILLDRKEKQVKVADFGIAIESDEGEEKNNVIIGTPSYMSPEQASGKKADHRSDIYSTGVILYEMLTGSVPFTGETSMAIIIKHLNEQAGSMTDKNPEVPPQLEEIVQRALEKEPAHRYQSIRDLASQLKKATSLLASWQAAAKEGGSRSNSLSMSRPGSMSIATVMPESEEERMRRLAGYAVAGFVSLLALGVLFYLFVLAPPTYAAEDVRSELGFTQAHLQFRSSHPMRTRVEYKEEGSTEVQLFVGEGESLSHEVLLEGLREDSSYRWRPVFPAEQIGDWQSFQTRKLEFSDVRIVPQVGGARISWKTSLEVEMAIEYMRDGEVQEIQRLAGGAAREHSFSASFPNPDVPYQVRLKAILDGRFHATHMLEKVPTINLSQVGKISSSVLSSIQHPRFDELFPEDAEERLRRSGVSEKLRKFASIRELFFSDANVPAKERTHLVMALNRLWEFELFQTWHGGRFVSGAAKALGDGFLSGTRVPFSAGNALSLVPRGKRMVFDPQPPGEPITGGLPDDAKDNMKFMVEDLQGLEKAGEAYLELRCEEVAPNCFFRVDYGYSRTPQGSAYFFPPKASVTGHRPWSGTYRVRVDHRVITRSPLQGWVRLRFLRGTVTSEEDLAKVAGTLQSVRLQYR